MHPRTASYVGLLLLLPALPAPAIAGWIVDGIPVCYASGDQSAHQVVADGTGGCIVAWQDRRGANFDIYALRVSAAGELAPGWPLNGRATCAAVGDQFAPAITGGGTGGAIVAWQDRRAGNHDIYALRLTASGAVAPGWTANGTPVCTLPSSQASPAIVADGAGGAIVLWADARSGWSWDIYAQHLLAGGTLDPAWPAGGALVCVDSAHQLDPRAVPDGASGAVVTWTDYRSGSAQVFMQRLAAGGAIAPGWQAGGLLVIPVLPSNPYALCGDGAGGAFAAWDGARVLHLTGAGALAPGWDPNGVLVASGYAPSLASDGGTGALVAWYSPQSSPQIGATRLRADGTRATGWPNVVPVSSVAADQFNPKIVSDGAGGAFVAWHDRRSDPYTTDLYAMRITSGGTPAAGWTPNGEPLCSDPYEQNDLRLVADGLGGAVAVWMDWRNGDFFFNVNSDIYAQRLVVNRPVAAEASLVSADASPDRVRIVWYAPAVSSATVYRAGEDGAWRRLGAVSPGGDGRLAFEDRDVTAGSRYGYRLGIATAAGERFAGETWVEVPGAAALALYGLQPNPASRDLVVSFALPDEAPATLELLDLAGRRVAERPVGELGAGEHRVSLGRAERLEPGIYLVRLTHGGRTLTARACVVR